MGCEPGGERPWQPTSAQRSTCRDVRGRTPRLATVFGVSVRARVSARLGILLAATTTSLILVALLLPGSAAAQDTNSLQSIEPADGVSLPASPEQIVLSFNQELEDDDALSLTLNCPELQNTGIPEVDDDRLIVTVAVNTPVPRGSCFVTWVLRDGLGEIIVQGQSTFSVTADAPVATNGATTTTAPFITVPAVAPSAPTAAEPETQGSIGATLWFGRLVSTLGILVVFGGLALISVGWPEGPEYIVTVRFLRSAWLIALLGTVLYLIAYAADFGNISFGSAVNPGKWLDLNDDGWPGRGALLRLLFIATSGWVAMRPERIIDPQSAMWAWALPGFGLIAVAMSRVEGPVAPIGFGVNVIHVLGSAVWIGGALLVARVVLAGPGEEDLVQATRAFSRISMPAMFVVVITGLIQLVRLVGGSLFSSSHGQVLLLKVVAVAAMLAVSLAARQQVTMRLDRAHELTAPLADRFRRAFHAEAAIGIVVLAFSGWLLALTPANVDPLDDDGDYRLEVAFNDSASGVEATVFIGPSAVGLNGIKIEVEEPAEGITDLRLRFIPPIGSQAVGYEQPIPLTTAGTAVLDESVGLPFSVAGTWTIQLVATTTIGVQSGAETTFLVTNADGTTATIPQVVGTTPVQVEIVDPTPGTTAPFATSTTTTLAPTDTTAESG